MKTPTRSIWKGAVLIIAVMWICTGCSDVGDDGPGFGENTSVRDALIAQGVDLDVLFAPPTEAELAAVQADWSGRDVSAQNIVEAFTTGVGNGSTLRIVSHTVNGQRRFGAIQLPAHAVETASMPILLILAGFGPPYTITISESGINNFSFVQDFVIVIPAYRGYRLRFQDQTWQSDGDLWDQCDGATDDVLASLNVVLATTQVADPTRVAASGSSRGSNVSLIAAARDPRIQYVVGISGTMDQLQQSYLIHGNLFVLYQEWYVRDLLDGVGTIAQARHKMLACSPPYFTDLLPFVQIHHGTDDQAVPVSHAQALIDAMQRLGRTPPEFEALLYEGVDHDLTPVLDTVDAHTKTFFAPLIDR